MILYDAQGRVKLNVETNQAPNNNTTNITIGGDCDDDDSGVTKLNVANDNDGLLYSVGVENINGQAVIYLWKGGNTKLIAGVYYIKNDDDGLWYPVKSENINGQAVLYLGSGLVL